MAFIFHQAIPATQLVDVVPSVLAAGGSPLQFWGLIVDANLDSSGYPLMPMGEVLFFSDAVDVGVHFGAVSQEAGLADVYFRGPVGSTRLPSGLLMSQYALAAVPGYLRGGDVSGLTLGQLQAVNADLSISIDGADEITRTIDLSTATSFSIAATIIGSSLGIAGIQKGTVTASLSGNLMTVSAFTPSNAAGPHRASLVASLSGTNMTVTDVVAGYPQPGQIVVGTGIPAGTTIVAYLGGGQSGGVGTYRLSQSVSAETGESIDAYDAAPVILVGDVVAGTGIAPSVYVTGQTSGTTGSSGTYTLSANITTESDDTITLYAPGCAYSPVHHAFIVRSATIGDSSGVSFATGDAAVALRLTPATGAMQSAGAGPSDPVTFMSDITLRTQNWVSFMTTWEPTDEDKATNQESSFAGWTNAQNNAYRYCMWETDPIDTQFSTGPSAAVTAINNADMSGTVMIYTDPAITTLAGEKAACSMSWAASLDPTRRRGRRTEAFRAYTGGLPDVTDGRIAATLAGLPQSGTFGFGINFYGDYTTRSQGFPQFQRGLISGPFVWDDTYVDQIWLNAALQNAIMVGLTAANSVPYSNSGYATIEAWCLDPILAAVDFGAIVPGVELSNEQAVAVNTAAGIEIAPTITQRGWYLQVGPALPATRAVRASPPCTLWWADGGSVQAITLASITIQ